MSDTMSDDVLADNLADTASNYSDATDSPPPIRAHGHLYHHSGRVWTPCDESERGRQDKLGLIFKLALDGAHTTMPVPLDKPVQILDIGTGTGRWALDMGAAYPLAQVTGIDISAALLPTEMPRNVNFEIEDVELGYDGDRIGAFDFVHIRSLEPAGINDWPRFLGRVYNWLKPGGWIEFGSMGLTWVDPSTTPNDGYVCVYDAYPLNVIFLISFSSFSSYFLRSHAPCQRLRSLLKQSIGGMMSLTLRNTRKSHLLAPMLLHSRRPGLRRQNFTKCTRPLSIQSQPGFPKSGSKRWFPETT